MAASRLHPDAVDEAERRIAWVLAHPGFSPWLKRALRAALAADPVDVCNDVEVLRELLRFRADAMIDQWFVVRTQDSMSHTRGKRTQ